VLLLKYDTGDSLWRRIFSLSFYFFKTIPMDFLVMINLCDFIFTHYFLIPNLILSLPHEENFWSSSEPFFARFSSPD